MEIKSFIKVSQAKVKIPEVATLENAIYVYAVKNKVLCSAEKCSVIWAKRFGQTEYLVGHYHTASIMLYY